MINKAFRTSDWAGNSPCHKTGVSPDNVAHLLLLPDDGTDFQSVVYIFNPKMLNLINKMQTFYIYSVSSLSVGMRIDFANVKKK